MPLPENFNIHSFDNVDLWHVTRALAEAVPGLHVARILKSRYNANRGVSYMRAFLRTPEVEGQQVEFENADFLGTSEEMEALAQQTELAMGEPHRFEGVVRDAASAKTNNPELQHRSAKAFLPYVGRMSLAKIIKRESDGALIRLSSAAQITRHARATPQNLRVHAEINVHLASLAGEELGPYQEVVARTASWRPDDSVPTSLRWLAPLPPAPPPQQDGR